jgi:TolA-binding protein
MKRKFRLKIIIFLLFSLSILSGCGIWENLTTYFNLYYNATDLFSKVEDQVNAQQTELFETKEENLPGSVTTDLNKVIDKCSQILQFHPNSSYVDDALMMLGKSFFYQRNYLKAVRKFQELIATQPKSDLVLDANLWIGKSDLKLRNYDDAIKILEDVRKQAADQDRQNVLKETYIEEIKYRISTEDYAGAISLLQDFLKSSGDGEVNAQIAFEMGKLYLEQQDLQNAVASFQKVFDYSPTYDLEFQAKINLAESLRGIGKNEDALNILESMRSEDKYSDSYDIIDLETGITLDSLKRYDEAVDVLVKTDTTYKTSTSSGAAKFVLGQIYENHYLKFDSAKIYYNAAVSAPSPPDYKKLALSKSNLLNRYSHLKFAVYYNQEKLFYSQNPGQYKEDSVKYMTDSLNYVKDSLQAYEEYARYEELLKTISSFDTTKVIDSVALKDSLAITDSLLAIDSTISKDSLSSWYARVKLSDSLAITDSLLAIDNTISKDSLSSWYAHVKQIKEQQKQENQNQFPGNNKQLVKNNPPGMNQPRKNIKIMKPKLHKPARPDISVDSIMENIALNELAYGNMFLTEFNIPDTAYYYYEDILNNFPNSNYEARTLYALGSYYLTENQQEKADSLFNVIYNNYKNESIVNAAADKLKKPLIDLSYDPAKSLYVGAEKTFLDSNYSASIDSFYNIYKIYPQSQYAAKALYASGWVLENKLNLLDSAAVMYDSVVTKFPSSVYAQTVREKLQFYKQEEAKRKKAIEDSLKTLRLKQDSLAISDSLKNNQEVQSQNLEKQNMPDSLVNKKRGTLPPGIMDRDLELRRQRMLDSLANKNKKSNEIPGGNQINLPDSLKSDTTKIEDHRPQK